MNTMTSGHSYTCHRFPPAIMGRAVWLYFRFALSDREVEELLAERGVIATYETVRRRCRKSGRTYASPLRRRRPKHGDGRHLDAVFIQNNGRQHYLSRAVDRDGNVLDIPVWPRRAKAAAVRFLRKRLNGLAYVPRVLIADKLASHGAAGRAVRPGVEHRQHRRLNNRAEHARHPTRERERRMRRFNSPGHARRLLAAYGPIGSPFRPRRHRLTAAAHRETRHERFAIRRAVTGTPALA